MDPRRDVYTTQQPDGTYVTTTTKTRTTYKEDEVYSCGIGSLNKKYCFGPLGVIRILEIFLCLVIVSLITSVYGPGPFKGVLFGQTMILIFVGVCLCVSFIFLLAYFFTLNETHLDFFPWTVVDVFFSAVAGFLLLIFSFVEGYYSTGSWSDNCNDIGSDGIIHNGCRFVFEWIFAAVLLFFLSILYFLSAGLTHRGRNNINETRIREY